MINVSNAWKEAHKQALLPETFVEITLDIVDTPESVTVSGSNEATFSNSNAIVNNADYGFGTKYAVLEHNLWTLDGSCAIMEGSEKAPGFVSANGSDSSSVVVDLGAVSKSQIPGFTIVWDGEYETFADTFSVRVMNGDTEVAYKHITNNSSNISVIDLPVSGYDSVEIDILRWGHTNQRNRIDSVKLGHGIIFGKDEIISYSHEMSGSPLGTELSKNAIEFEVDNSDGRWNLLNPTGLSKYLYERQKLVVRYGQQTGAGVEWIKAGVFYLTEWKAPSNGITATFVARDAICFMLSSTYSRPYREGITTGEVTAYSTKDGVIDRNGDMGTGTVITTLTSGTTVKIYEETMQIAARYDEEDFDASGWYVYKTDHGWVYPLNVQITSSSALNDDVIASAQSCLPDDVQTSFNFGLMNKPGAIPDTIIAEFLQQVAASLAYTLWQDRDGRVVIDAPRVSTPVYTISADVSYSYPQVDLARPLKELNVVCHSQHRTATTTRTFAYNTEGDSIIVDAPYIWADDDSVLPVVEKHSAWWKHREIVAGEFRADPRLELFDCVEVETKYGTLSPVMITYLKYTYNGSFRAVYEGKVVEV